MPDLANAKTEDVRATSPHVTHDEVKTYLEEIPGWQVTNHEDMNRLEKTYFFKDWTESIAFAVNVGEIAETANHHPAITVEWGRVTVRWWTHVIGGLHTNDFIMAARTEALVPRNCD